MSEHASLGRQLTVLHDATVAAAEHVVARPKDGSFLEKTLRDGLAAQLPLAKTEQPLSLDRDVWPGRLGGVDVLYIDVGTRVGVETKVWDVADSLYDVLKLAAGTQIATIALGFCAIAGRSSDRRARSAIGSISQRTPGTPVDWEAAALLRDHEGEWTRIWGRTAIRPTDIPAGLRTLAGEPIPMPKVPAIRARSSRSRACARTREHVVREGATHREDRRLRESLALPAPSPDPPLFDAVEPLIGERLEQRPAGGVLPEMLAADVRGGEPAQDLGSALHDGLLPFGLARNRVAPAAPVRGVAAAASLGTVLGRAVRRTRDVHARRSGLAPVRHDPSS